MDLSLLSPPTYAFMARMGTTLLTFGLSTVKKILVTSAAGSTPICIDMHLLIDTNIRTDFRVAVWDSTDRIHLAQDRNKWQNLGNTAMKLLSHKSSEFTLLMRNYWVLVFRYFYFRTQLRRSG